jgi:uncharacterized protein
LGGRTIREGSTRGRRVVGAIRESSLRWIFILALALWLVIDLGARIGGEVLWFQEVGYLSVFRIRLITQAILFAIVFLLSTIYLFGNLALVRRLRDVQLASPTQKTTNLIRRDFHQPIITEYRFIPLRLRGLLIAGSGCIALLALLFAYYGQVAGSPGFNSTTLSQFTASSIPSLFKSNVSWPSVQQSLFSARFLIGLLIGSIALLLYPQILLSAIAVAMTLLMSFGIARRWGVVLQALHPTSFGQRDPLFSQDISAYFFSLPIWELCVFWLVGVSVTGMLLVTLTYLFSGNSLSEGNFPGFSFQQQRHLFGLGAVLMLAVALSFWLGRYELLYSPRGVSYGASYTDVAVQLPAYTVLSILALLIAGYLCWHTLVRGRKQKPDRLILLGLGLYLGLALVITTLAPSLVQALVVQPNELAREQPYIQRTIAFTRRAFGLEAIDTRSFNPQGQLTQADLKTNNLTIRNIRLWDQQPLLETNRQLQQIRSYYRFPDADIDRYTFLSDAKAKPPTLSKQQVLISPRELDYQAVPKQAQTWINKHLIYTHGYGFTLSPVNRVGPGGLPDYFVKDIGITEGTPLTTSSEAVRASIPIGQPRIYYGELTNTYVMTRTKVKELDYPSGNDNVYNTYDGLGGINLGSTWRRWLFAKYLNDWRTIFTPEFLPDTKLMFRRNINQRIQAIAPFLRYDSDPYLVAADATPGKPSRDPSYLYWIIDAYTTSDRYPYSDVGQEGINYIRNSVKVVVDAYHGSVDFYISDPSDPMIRTWSTIFPNLLKPLSTMPSTLRNHLRYPVDFFKLQSDRLLTYHMTDPQVFYNREDQWQIPTEVYGSKPRLVEPYYLITSLPTVPYEEFILLLPYTPKERTNLIAWLAARSDGKNYGKLLLYVFPKQRLVYGPEQIEARINQDPVISQQISLWNREGSKVIQGNLLIIPIEQSLLYVEPLYLEATQNQLPTLVRVIVAYENRIVMAQTLEQALTGIFQGETVTPPIVRSVETEAP